MPTSFRGYPDIPVNVEPDVPHWLGLALQAVDKDVQSVEDRSVSKDRENLILLREEAQEILATATSTAKSYTNTKDSAVREAMTAADTAARAAAVASAKSYTDTKDSAVREDMTAADTAARTAAVASAKTYTDAAATAAAADAAAKATAARKGAVDDVTPAITKLQDESWLKHTPQTAVDLNEFITSGFVGVISSESTSLPIKAQGILEVFKFGSAITQRFTTYVVRVRVFVRHRTGSGTWNAWVEPGRSPVPVPADGDLDTITLPGTYDVTSTGGVLNIPVPQIGALEVLQVARAVIQRYTVWNVYTEPRVFIRVAQVDVASWLPWYEVPGSAVVAALRDEVTAQTAALWAIKARTPGQGFKRAHLALNQASGSSTESVAAAMVRWPVTLGVTSHRARLHLRNWNWAVGTTADYTFTYKGAVSFTGLWVGPADGKKFTADPVRALGAFTTSANGDEYVSEWFSYEFTEDIQHLVSLGYTTAEGQINYMGRGGCWRNTSPADAAALDPAAEVSLTSPFDVWLELEVPATTPVLAGFGDSNTVGTGTSLPVHDSWLAQYCRRNRAVPLFLANHGSSASSWAGREANKWNRFRDVAQADAAVYFLHQNDLQATITLPELKQRFKDTLAILRERITPNVYGATITPGNKAESVDTVRKQFNTWLKSRPEGLLDCFDFAAAVSDDDLKIRPEDSFDGLHFKTGGHGKIADALAVRPVTPRVMTRREIDLVLAGADAR